MTSTLSEKRLAFLLFCALFIAFIAAPVVQTTDSRFSLLVSHAIYHDHTLNLRPFVEGKYIEEETSLRHWWFDRIPDPQDERWLYRYPLGSSWLSIPFVAVLEWAGLPLVDEQHQFHAANEWWQHKIIASILMAVYGVFAYFLVRLRLPRKPALWTTLAMMMATSVLSTLSRGVWSDTWGCLLTIMALYITARQHYRPVMAPFIVQVRQSLLLAILLSFAFFCKPIYAIGVAAMGLWWLWHSPRQAFIMAALGALAFIGLMVYSRFFLSGRWLPPFFDVLTMSVGFSVSNLFQFLDGQLYSPSRGVFIFWPWLIYVLGGLMVFGWARRINGIDVIPILASLLVTVSVLLIISAWGFWWAGMAYGPRLMVPALPWLTLLMAIVVSTHLQAQGDFEKKLGMVSPKQSAIKTLAKSADAKHDTPTSKPPLSHPLLTAIGGLTLIIALFINIWGGVQTKTWIPWFRLPTPIFEDESRLWDWKNPIFLAGLVYPERYFSVTYESNHEAVPSLSPNQ